MEINTLTAKDWYISHGLMHNFVHILALAHDNPEVSIVLINENIYNTWMVTNINGFLSS